MSKETVIAWGGSALAGLILGGIVYGLGAPIWAAFSVGYLGFWVQRVGDKVRVDIAEWIAVAQSRGPR